MGSNTDALRLKARNLFIYQGKSLTEVATEVGRAVSSIERWKSLDKAEGLDWDISRQAHVTGPGETKRELESCLSLVLNQAKKALEEVELDPDLKSAKRAVVVTSLMDTIHKATASAKRLEPEVDREQVIQRMMQIISEEIVALNDPNLTEAWKELTHKLENRINKEKGLWQ